MTRVPFPKKFEQGKGRRMRREGQKFCVFAFTAAIVGWGVAAGQHPYTVDGPIAGVSGTSREWFCLRVGNEWGGAVEVSEDGGHTWHRLGQVLVPATAVRADRFAAARWGQPGTVVAAAVNAVHLAVGLDVARQRMATFSLAPRQEALPVPPESIRAHDPSVLLTDLPAGRGLFGGRFAPFVGSPVFFQRMADTAGPSAPAAAPSGRPGTWIPLPSDYTPTAGDRLVLVVAGPPRKLAALVIENRFGGAVTAEYADGGMDTVARVVKPVVGVGGFPGSAFAGVGMVRANHPGVLEISTSPFGQTGAFQIVPQEHADTPTLAYARAGPSWLVVRAIPKGDRIAGTPPLFAETIRPWSGYPEEAPGPGQVERCLCRSAADQPWQPLSARQGFPAEEALRGIAWLRLEFHGASKGIRPSDDS